MKRKITALILLLSLVLCILPVSAASYEAESSMSNLGLFEFLDMIGIGNSSKSGDEYVTRAEFVSYVTKAMNVNVSSDNDGTFADVPVSHPFSDDIYKAKELGIITGAGGNEFRPDDEISYMEAVKICVMALGYMRIAEVMGGYPYGYLAVARDIDLTDGVADVKKMQYSGVAIMLRNFLISDMCKANVVIGEDISQQRVLGLNILKHFHGLEMVSGVVKTAGYISMVPDYKSQEYTLNISGKIFKTEIENAENYLGYNVTAFYSEDTNEIKALYLGKRNNTLSFQTEDVSGYNGEKLKVLSGDKEKEYKLDPGFSYVKNGRIIRHQNADFSLDNGSMVLIDNNGDNLYDVVIVKECTYMVVTGNSITGESIFDARINKSISFSNEGDSKYYLTMMEDDLLYNIKPAQISGNCVLEVYESADGSYLEVIAVKKSVSGTVEEISEDYVLIDGMKYKLNSYFKTHFTIEPGDTADFILSANGTITAIGKASASVKYGFLMDFGILEKGLEKTVWAKILDQGGSIITAELAERIKLDGIFVKNMDKEISDALANGDYPKYQVLKYKTDSDGKISEIDTAMVASGTAEDKYNSKLHNGDDLTMNYNSRSVYIYRGYNVLQPISTTSGNTIIFTVPSCLAAANNTEGTDQRLARYEDKNYSVSATISAPLTSSGNYYVDIYDINESLEAKAVVMYIKNVNSGAALNTDTDPALVYKVTDAVNGDGELTKKVTVWSRGVFNTYFISPGLISDLTQEQIPKSGDIVRLTTDSFGEIAGIDIDVKYNEKTGKPEINTGVANKRDQAQWAYYGGKLFGISANSLAINIDQEPPFNQSFAGEFSGYIDNMVPLMLNGSTFYAGYDTKLGTVYRMKNTDFKGSSSVGSGDASYVITYEYAGWARLVVEYGVR